MSNSSPHPLFGQAIEYNSLFCIPASRVWSDEKSDSDASYESCWPRRKTSDWRIARRLFNWMTLSHIFEEFWTSFSLSLPFSMPVLGSVECYAVTTCTKTGCSHFLMAQILASQDYGPNDRTSLSCCRDVNMIFARRIRTLANSILFADCGIE